ncbi:MAG: amidohydrolase [Planctomycetota bacterium]|nr:amidohydrolase [Planctomycetota bacterium]
MPATAWPSAVEADLPRLIEIRRHLHAHPELAFEEFETSKLVQRELAGLGLEVRAGLAKGTGVVAVLRGTAPGASGKDARAVALRGDMDALPIHEETGLPYASTIPGKMHACGHDAHTTMLLGAARVLSRHRDRLQGSVVFCFQPAEEGGGGGRYLVDEGALDDPACAAAFALHGFPNLPVGHVAVKPGVAQAASDSLRIKVLGVGGHGAAPHKSVDPIVLSARVIEALQGVVSREVNPVDSAVVTVGAIHGGEAGNVIPPSVEMKGTIRSLDEAVRRQVHAAVKRTVELTCAAGGGKAEVLVHDGYPVLTNDPGASRFALETARELFGAPKVHELPVPSMGGEDFAYYLQKVPGAFIRVGVATREAYPGLHHPAYDFTDAALGVGVALFCRLAERFLAEGFGEAD